MRIPEAMVKTKKGSRKRESKVQVAPVGLTEEQQQVKFTPQEQKYGHLSYKSFECLVAVMDVNQQKLQQRDQCDLLLRDFDKQVSHTI